MSKRKPNAVRNNLSDGLSVRRSTDGQSWVFVHPREARDRAEDLEEVQMMIEAGEMDVALDELRWLLSGCSEFIAAHVLLGEIARAGGDLPLARAHYGAGYQLGLQTLRRAKMPKPLLYSQLANQSFFEAGQGLVWTLEKLGKPQMAEEIVATLIELDPSDPLQLRAMLDELRSGGAPIVDLSPKFPAIRSTASYASPDLHALRRPPRKHATRQPPPIRRLQKQLARLRRLPAMPEDPVRQIRPQLRRPDPRRMTSHEHKRATLRRQLSTQLQQRQQMLANLPRLAPRPMPIRRRIENHRIVLDCRV